MFSAKLIATTAPCKEMIDQGIETLHDLIAYCARVSNPGGQLNNDTAEKLTNYLFKHKHFSPFEMVNCVVEINCPRDIARQILRHRSFSFQEFSQRYAEVSQLKTSFCKRELRLQDVKNRQNSIPSNCFELSSWWNDTQQEIINLVNIRYEQALKKGIAKEIARAILPEGLTMSRIYVNGTIRSWIHYLQVRMEEGVTQQEHVILARLISDQINTVFKVI